ncbi:MAG: PHP domain-containing protein [Spirochaetales bacterium]|nr:PHP domain-containing protein [Spirochaetales bacterium]
MFETDLHAHSLFSACGLHTIIEMLTAAKIKGIRGQAITDHGPFLGRRPSSTFFERLENPVKGIRFFKGMECNVTDEAGSIDVIPKFMKWYDVVLVGFHNFSIKDAPPEYYAKIMTKALRTNPCIDIIVHPNAPHFVIDFKMIAETAAETGTAIELNNAKTRLGRSTEEQTISLIEACIEAGCDVTVNTDAHALNEVGNTDVIEALLKKTAFPTEKIVNRTLESTIEWIAKRKAIRAEFY